MLVSEQLNLFWIIIVFHIMILPYSPNSSVFVLWSGLIPHFVYLWRSNRASEVSNKYLLPDYIDIPIAPRPPSQYMVPCHCVEWLYRSRKYNPGWEGGRQQVSTAEEPDGIASGSPVSTAFWHLQIFGKSPWPANLWDRSKGKGLLACIKGTEGVWFDMEGGSRELWGEQRKSCLLSVCRQVVCTYIAF